MLVRTWYVGQVFLCGFLYALLKLVAKKQCVVINTYVL